MSGVAGAEVLARIDASRWHVRGHDYREEVRAWLRANGIEPRDVPVEDVQVVLLDAPMFVRRELIRDDEGRVCRDPADRDGIWCRTVHSLLRVPLPDHLADR